MVFRFGGSVSEAKSQITIFQSLDAVKTYLEFLDQLRRQTNLATREDLRLQLDALDADDALDVSIQPPHRRLRVQIPHSRGAVRPSRGDEAPGGVKPRDGRAGVQRRLHRGGVRDRERVCAHSVSSAPLSQSVHVLDSWPFMVCSPG